ncbi:MAG: Type-1 restriction enzyme EcoKI specificity protein [Verrucomicrobia subdivision 3 bacterium]|nr:Type-1 restriction enzyme EcoKI specificity protein [Limisphaerales bacterium]MCS1412831.1 Type-1 restriction enzyme EcoKI specificity protein [Limisphaerales bacterium]
MQAEEKRLPKGWLHAPLGQTIQPRGEKVSPSEHPDDRFIGMDHVESHSTKILGSLPASSMKSSAARFRSGDVLYGRLRPYLNKVAQPNFDGLASAEFIVFPDTKLIYSCFLKHRLNAADFVSFASHLNEGDRPRVNFDQIGEFMMLIPPLQEQHRIVTKIEELFAELDKGVESLKKAREQLKVYRQAVLKHAFEGKLTAQWREENKDKLETPEQLLARIKQEREARYEQQLEEWNAEVRAWEKNAKIGRKATKPSGFKMPVPIAQSELAKLPDIPSSWQYVRLSEIARVGSGKSVSRSRKLADPIEVPYLRVANVQRGKLDLSMTKSMKIERSQLVGLALRRWDVLFNEGGDRDKLGRGWVWESQIEPCVTQNHVFRASPFLESFQHSKWISHWGNTLGQLYFEAQGKQTTNLASINKTVLSKFPIPLAPIAEQEEILRRVESQTATIDHLEHKVAKSLEQMNALRQSILKKAFSGQLVPQDPNDEPASKLLECIKAEKANDKSPQRSRRGKTPA